MKIMPITAFAAMMLSAVSPALAWTFEEDDFLPFITQPDQSGQFELKLACDGLMGTFFISFTTNETWSDANTYPSEIPLVLDVNGKQHGGYAFSVGPGRNALLGSDVVELSLYEGAAGWDQIATALPVAQGTISVLYGEQAIRFEAGNYNDAMWTLYDSCA